MSIDLLRRALLDARPGPFALGFVGEPWDEAYIPDAERVHAKPTRGIREAVARVRATGISRAAVLLGVTGVGKSHVVRRFARATDLDGYLAYLRPSGDPRWILRELLSSVVTDLARPRPGLRRPPIREVVDATLAEFHAEAAARDPAFRVAVDRILEAEPPIWEKEALARPVLRGLGTHVARAQPPLEPLVARVLLLSLIPARRAAAIDWLRGREISPEDERRLFAGEEEPTATLRAEVDEAGALRRLLGIGRLLSLNRPVLLCIDQVESLNDGRGTAFRALIDACLRLVAGPGYLVLITCLEDIFVQHIAPLLAPGERRALASDPWTLEPPDLDGATEILAARLSTVYGDLETRPPYPTYPFPKETIATWGDSGPLTARELLRRASLAVERLRTGGAAWPQVATTPPTAEEEAEAAEAARVRAFKDVWRRRTGGPPARTEKDDAAVGARLMEGLRLLLAELARRRQNVPCPILSIEVPADSTLGFIVHVARSRGASAPEVTVGLAYAEGQQAHRLDQVASDLAGGLERGDLAQAALVRLTPPRRDGAGRPIPSIEAFEARGGRVIVLDERARRAAHALHDLRAEAAAGDLHLSGEGLAPEAATTLAVDTILAEEPTLVGALRSALG